MLLFLKALQFFFETGADDGKAAVMLLGIGFHPGSELVSAKAVLVHVGAVDDGLCSEQAHLAPEVAGCIVLAVPLEALGWIALVQVGCELFHHFCQGAGLLGGAAELLQLLEPSLHSLKVCQKQFGLDGGDVAQGVNGAIHVGDVLVLEAAHHFHDGSAFADVAKELVAKALALACTAHKACDVDEIH